MNFITLALTPYKAYHNINYTDEEMLIIGNFFMSDFACGSQSYQKWAVEDFSTNTASSNCTLLERNTELILLSNLYSELKKPIQVKITRQNFIDLCNEWQEKVCTHKPKEVTIKYDNDQFSIETKN